MQHTAIYSCFYNRFSFLTFPHPINTENYQRVEFASNFLAQENSKCFYMNTPYFEYISTMIYSYISAFADKTKVMDYEQNKDKYVNGSKSTEFIDAVEKIEKFIDANISVTHNLIFKMSFRP